ncbi:CynX/NimT family MFS transporter [Actinomadura rugatobispora]|uniref:CynX/NimT family MFS transporter n=1 Tax=Actinomadura rugatobispora TaxID=1994 RepID=A0ABW0ZP29_9ACTN|nr:CynX/NimT family MFS transporter [Actinomadura rugatobispora]
MTASSPNISRATAAWTFLGLILLTVNLRAAITGISPMLADLRDVFGLSGVEVSVLTTLPVLCLGLFAYLAPLLARRLGAEPAIALSLLLITAGIVLRVVPSRAALFAGTVLAGAGIAMGNVLTPSVVKRVFPRRVGSLTGMAMMLMATSGAIAAGLAVPLNDAAGWRVALAVWAVPSLFAALAWGPLALRGRRREDATPVRDGASAGAERGHGSLLRSPLAWHVTAFLGLASLMFYVLMSWLPEIMRDHGQPPAAAGSMVSVMMIIGIPLGFLAPVVAARMRDQRPLIVGIAAIMAVGLTGLLLFPEPAWVWVTILGVATGSAFPLGFTLLTLRSPTPLVAARLSGMAQGGGYLLAGLGPLAVGLLHSATGNWDVSLGLLLALVVPELIFGLLAARPAFVRTGPPRREEGVEKLIEPKGVPAAVPAGSAAGGRNALG